MDKLIITALRGKTAAVLFENGRAVRIDFEPEAAEEETGVIFVGKVKNIAKNINAAFVEYRPGVNGFYSLKENSCPLYADGKPDHGPLKAGDEILVQVERSAVKTKDAVLTSNLTLTGQTAVLTAGKSSLGISAKIRDKEWREAAKRRWEETSHGNCGLVIRTNGETAGLDAVFAEFESLFERYREICRIAASRTCCSVLYRPESFAVRTVRDLKISEGLEVVTDLPEVYKELQDALGTAVLPDAISGASPNAAGSGEHAAGMGAGRPVIRFYEDEFPLTALYHLETILSQALAKTVWLKSGGNLVIEPTEALTVIDVNTAKSVSKKTSEETYLKTNLEAAEAIAVQLRLRNLSGIIIVDFIDMKEEESRKAAEEFSHCLMEMVPEACGSVLVAGLGNRGITPDALGPETVEQLNVTRHLVRTYGKKGREVSALAPGVMAQTGMEAVEILRGTAEQTHPDVILAVDALAACSIHRLNCTIQLADTGIWPGSGVGNHRNALNQETLGVPVIGIGVPTVVGAGTIVHDAVAGVLESLEESEMDEFLGEVISPALESLYVTTKEIDEMVRRLAGVLAAGMNQAFSGEL